MDKQKFNGFLERIRENDKFALEPIYNEYCKKIKWVAFITIGKWDFAEDILNEVLIKIWNHAGQEVHNPNAWIYEISKNTAHDYYRKNVKRFEDCVSLETLSDGDKKSRNDRYDILEFQDLLYGLDATDREIVTKKVLFLYTHREIAEELRMPLNTVLSRYHKALIKLKKELPEG